MCSSCFPTSDLQICERRNLCCSKPGLWRFVTAAKETSREQAQRGAGHRPRPPGMGPGIPDLPSRGLERSCRLRLVTHAKGGGCFLLTVSMTCLVARGRTPTPASWIKDVKQVCDRKEEKCPGFGCGWIQGFKGTVASSVSVSLPRPLSPLPLRVGPMISLCRQAPSSSLATCDLPKPSFVYPLHSPTRSRQHTKTREVSDWPTAGLVRWTGALRLAWPGPRASLCAE